MLLVGFWKGWVHSRRINEVFSHNKFVEHSGFSYSDGICSYASGSYIP